MSGQTKGADGAKEDQREQVKQIVGKLVDGTGLQVRQLANGLALAGAPKAERICGCQWNDPGGRLPWEAKDPSAFAGVRGSNVDDLVGAGGFEPPTPR